MAVLLNDENPQAQTERDLVTNDSLTRLTIEVNQRMDAGWIVAGEMFGEMVNGKLTYFQPMARIAQAQIAAPVRQTVTAGRVARKALEVANDWLERLQIGDGSE